MFQTIGEHAHPALIVHAFKEAAGLSVACVMDGRFYAGNKATKFLVTVKYKGDIEIVPLPFVVTWNLVIFADTAMQSFKKLILQRLGSTLEGPSFRTWAESNLGGYITSESTGRELDEFINDPIKGKRMLGLGDLEVIPALEPTKPQESIPFGIPDIRGVFNKFYEPSTIQNKERYRVTSNKVFYEEWSGPTSPKTMEEEALNLLPTQGFKYQEVTTERKSKMDAIKKIEAIIPMEEEVKVAEPTRQDEEIRAKKPFFNVAVGIVKPSKRVRKETPEERMSKLEDIIRGWDAERAKPRETSEMSVTPQLGKIRPSQGYWAEKEASERKRRIIDRKNQLKRKAAEKMAKSPEES